ncbi:CAP domain-containing protein [Virgibacillus sp. FSP13]
MILLKLRNLIVLILVAGALWYVYGDTYNRSGVQGVIEDMQADVNELKENPIVIDTVDTINQGFQKLVGFFTESESEDQQPTHEKPQLDAPSEQTFSIHNVELGDDRSEVEQQVGKPKRSSMNEYGVNWAAYHENYQNFFMAAYDEHDKVIGLYTDQDLITSTNEITLESSKETVHKKLDEPLKGIRKGLVTYRMQNDGEYDTFQIDSNYVTVFYDKHENNTVTAIQIISDELEKQKKGFFAKPSAELKEGFEYQLFDLTNAARVKHGLSPLTWAKAVQTTARGHSTDMADNNYFSHTNLEGQSPFERMQEDGITFQMAGENIATGQTSSIFAHQGLMNSLGHRKNILKSGFKALAIGVAFNKESRPYYTENFLAK